MNNMNNDDSDNNNNDFNYIYFSNGFFGAYVLNELIKSNHIPKVLITSIHKPVGRKQILTPSLTEQILIDNNLLDKVHIIRAQKLKDISFLEEIKSFLNDKTIPLVCDYGKILPDELLNIKHNNIEFINIHPSELPFYRGPSPLQNTILNKLKETYITFIEMDKYMDHGPIIYKEKIILKNDLNTIQLAEYLSKFAALSFTKFAKLYLNNQIYKAEQNHDIATYTHMIEKKDSEIRLSDDIFDIYTKYLAYTPWPQIYYIDKQNKRVKIKEMIIENNIPKIKTIVTEGENPKEYKA